MKMPKNDLKKESHVFWIELVQKLYPLYHGHVHYTDVRDEILRLEGYFNEIMDVIYKEIEEK